MDQQHAGSSARGGRNDTKHTPSPHSQSYEDDINFSSIGLGISNSGSHDQFSTQQFLPSQNQPLFQQNTLQAHQFSQPNMGDSIYAPSQDQNFQPNFTQQLNSNDSFNNQELLNFDNNNNFLAANAFSQQDYPLFGNNSNLNQTYDPSLFLNDNSQQIPNQSVNPADLGLSNISTQHNSATPPQMFQNNFGQTTSAQPSPSFQQQQFSPAEVQQALSAQHSPSFIPQQQFSQAEMQQSISANHSPSFNQQHFPRSPGHSRNASLQPESAQFLNALLPVDWNGMVPQQFTNHRRTPSEYSDISASSAAHSPNLGLQDNFEHHSPMIHPQNSGMPQDLNGLDQFTISDNEWNTGLSPLHGRSPAHSPLPSPKLNPQQIPLHDITNQQSPFTLTMGNQPPMPPHMYSHNSAPDVYSGSNDQFKNEGSNSAEMGQAQQMPPPDINIEFAPASRQNSFEPPKPMQLDQDALTPPMRGRGRQRASSDVTGGAQFSRHSKFGGLSSGLGVNRASSPHAGRSASPGDRLGPAAQGHRRRQSTSALPANPRDYILSLADPEVQAGAAPENGKARSQKHPATFQCTLCPKKFTRAYNLRSHLRTHTDERPFVCTVCGKAFARQHDRKRHEGLHSGEKKFVCKGDLKGGGHWGCNRRFARADALGRHFRSEAGRICIRPLLDEEAFERQRVWQEQHYGQNMQQQQHISLDQNGFPIDPNGNYVLPARLLEQYPALANLTWANIPQGDPGMEDDVSGRSSFDASGSEFYEDGDESGYLSSHSGSGFIPQAQMSNQGFPQQTGYASDYGGR